MAWAIVPRRFWQSIFGKLGLDIVNIYWLVSEILLSVSSFCCTTQFDKVLYGVNQDMHNKC